MEEITVKQFIKKLKRYNPDAKMNVIANNRKQGFSLAFGDNEGVTKKSCLSVSIFVDKTNKSEST